MILLERFRIRTTSIALLTLLCISCNNQDKPQLDLIAKGLPNNNPWTPQAGFTCSSEGYTITILRKATYVNGDSPFKIEIRYASTIAEYCNFTRRNILSNAHSSDARFSASKVSSNAAWGDYCDKNNQWILGNVYYVTYPSSNQSTVYTTGIGHNSTLHLDTTNINDLVAVFNQLGGSTAPNCYDNDCSVWKDPKNETDEDRKLGSSHLLKKINKLIKKDIRYIDVKPRPIKNDDDSEVSNASNSNEKKQREKNNQN